MAKEINYSHKINPTDKPSYCKGCGAKIYWIKTDKGKNMPVDPDGVPHFATCPKVVQFRKVK
jgi:hypothetical protein